MEDDHNHDAFRFTSFQQPRPSAIALPSNPDWPAFPSTTHFDTLPLTPPPSHPLSTPPPQKPPPLFPPPPPPFSRHASFRYSESHQNPRPRRALDRVVSFTAPRPSTPHESPPSGSFLGAQEDDWKGQFVAPKEGGAAALNGLGSSEKKRRTLRENLLGLVLANPTSGSRASRRLLLLILLNATYTTSELLIGLFSGRIGLVSDAFHLTFGCGLLTFSLFAMSMSKSMPSNAYTYGYIFFVTLVDMQIFGFWSKWWPAIALHEYILRGYNRLEVLAAFTNALFLLFLSFSLVVEALHAFVEDESDHKHYLIVSAVANLLVNLIGVWFFRSHARMRIAYRKAEDMNHHSIFLHVLSDSIRSAGLVLASWLMTLGVKNAETLCFGLVAVIVFILVMPLFKATGGVLLQMSPNGISPSAFNKCLRQVTGYIDVMDCFQARFWEMVPGYVVGTMSLRVKTGADEQKLLQHVHSLYNDIGVKDLTVQIEWGD